ncbi:MAG: repressor LexA [Lentisphaerae bacterium GWF2_45_14]|nr:MAG: repressor LexA [Lentisphaerae bacterium GWF2_45_14]
MKGLTEKQRKMLDFIESFQERESMSPTVYEIADYFKIKTSTVFAHIRALQRKEYLSRSSKARSISITKSSKRAKAKHNTGIPSIPLLGKINSGVFTENLDKDGGVFCDPAATAGEDSKDLYALKVHGENMHDMGIFDGDVVIFKHTSQPQTGSVVVAFVNNETTVKRYVPKGEYIELRSADLNQQPQIYSASDVLIRGSVIALQRRY